MPQVAEVIVSDGWGGDYLKDKAAIKSGIPRDGLFYQGEPMTPGFDEVVLPGEAVSLMVVLEDGRIGVGDCCVSVFTGSGGRYGPVFREDIRQLIEEYIEPELVGKDIDSFREASNEIDTIQDGDKPVHPSVRYGASQAILDALANHRNVMRAEVLSEEYELPVSRERVNLGAQAGENRYFNVDKMISKRIDLIPHGSFKDVGRDGEDLKGYAKWVIDRIETYSDPDHDPDIRFDVYGSIGDEFDNDLDRVAEYLVELESIVGPRKLIVEMPVSLEDMESQIDAFLALREKLDGMDSDVLLAIDEFANTFEDVKEWVDRDAADFVQVKPIDMGSLTNTIESVRYVEDNGLLAYQGGTANETDVSARACVHAAMVTKPFAMQCKPGLGVDAAVTVVNNEMERILALYDRP